MMTNWDLVAKYLAGETTPEEAKDFEKWRIASEVNKAIVAKLKVAMRPSKSSENFEDYFEQDWNTIHQKIKKKASAKTSSKQVHFFSVYRIAAALVPLMIASFSFWYLTRQARGVDQRYGAVDSVKLVTLPDGSKVWLNKLSTLTVRNQFGEKTRDVILEGEAYFEVAKDKARPFLISSGKIVTQVVGTAFNIHHEKSGLVKVTVTEGNVLVKKNQNETVSLTRGEFATYSAGNGALVRGENRDLNFMAWKTGILRFDGESLKNVSIYLSRYYQADVRPQDAELDNVTISTVIDNADLENALLLISLTLNLKVEKRGQVFYLKK